MVEAEREETPSGFKPWRAVVGIFKGKPSASTLVAEVEQKDFFESQKIPMSMLLPEAVKHWNAKEEANGSDVRVAILITGGWE